jgi:hypothetical protein
LPCLIQLKTPMILYINHIVNGTKYPDLEKIR